MTEAKEEDYVLFWEAPKIEKPEFRLYYDAKGSVVCYTCEKLDGDYIVIDALTYAEGRPDVRVVNGKLVKINNNAVVSKLVPDEEEGQLCSIDDVSIIVTKKDKVKKQKWKLATYELG
jgi:hypothetical protein